MPFDFYLIPVMGCSLAKLPDELANGRKYNYHLIIFFSLFTINELPYNLYLKLNSEIIIFEYTMFFSVTL